MQEEVTPEASFQGTVGWVKRLGKVLPVEGSLCADSWVKCWPGVGRRDWTFAGVGLFSLLFM